MLNPTEFCLLLLEIVENKDKQDNDYIKAKLSEVEKTIIDTNISSLLHAIINSDDPIAEINNYLKFLKKEQNLLNSYKDQSFTGYINFNNIATPFDADKEDLSVDDEKEIVDVLLINNPTLRPATVSFFKSGNVYTVNV